MAVRILNIKKEPDGESPSSVMSPPPAYSPFSPPLASIAETPEAEVGMMI